MGTFVARSFRQTRRSLALAGALAWGCASAPVSDGGPHAEPSSAPSSLPPTPPLLVTSTASASAPPVAVAAPPGSTKGTIACGAVRCKAGAEACQMGDSEPHCVSLAATDGFDEYMFRCDDGLDCPSGLTCCSRWHDTGGARCVKRADVAAECRAELCVEGGARCPEGTRCESGGASVGSCEAPKGPATCANRQRCPSDKPFCVAAGGTHVCAAKGDAAYQSAKGDARFECTQQSDCNGGEQCSFAFGEVPNETRTFCSKYSPGFMGNRVCDARASSKTCAPGGDLPWLGIERR